MYTISRATKADLHAIKSLLAFYGKCDIEHYHLNKKDLAVQARLDDTGEIIGFAWAGLMGNNKIAYIDKVTVHPKYHKIGVLPAIYAALFKLGIKRGVLHVEGYIRHDQYHVASGKQALRMAFGADSMSYMRVYSNTKLILSERPDLKESSKEI